MKLHPMCAHEGCVWCQGELVRLRVLGPDTEARITVEAREIATDMLKPVVDSWRAEVERARERERAAIVAYLRERANAPHPTEAGERLLSPAGRGLLLLIADCIERGEHLKVEEE